VPFLLLWVGVVLSYLTDRVAQLGLLETVRSSVSNPGAVNNDLTLFMMLPFVFLSPLAGPLVDRRSRRAIVEITASGKAAVLVLIAVLLAGPLGLPRSLWFVYAIVLSLGILTVLFSPARTSLVPLLVENDHLLAANSLMNVTGMFMMLIGNFVGAALLGGVTGGAFSLSTFFLISAGGYLTGVVLFALMRIPASARRAARASEETYGARLRGGLRYAATHRVAWRLIGLAAAFWLVAGSVYTALNGKLLNEMRMGTDQFGLALGCLGIAVFAGGFTLTLGSRWLPSVAMTTRIAFGVVGLSVLSLMWLDRLALLMAPIVLIGLAGGGLLVLIMTLIQRTVPRRAHGRMFSLMETCHNAALIGALLGGRIALELVAFRPICWTVGAICLAAALGSVRVGNRKS
jgi:MFS family permease